MTGRYTVRMLHARTATPPPNDIAVPPAPLPGGLLYVHPLMPGFARVRCGRGFRYRHHEGHWIDDATEIARIRKLAIPPAYSQVWICPLVNGHLQATGLDARGRKQYRYHADWRLQRDEDKFGRLEAFGAVLPRIRARVARDLKVRPGQPLGRAAVLAALVRLLDTTCIRVGNEEYALSNGSYGLTTLRTPHAGVKGSLLKLRFRGKSGVLHEAMLDDPRVARVVRRCQQLPGQELFQYEGDEGEPRSLGSSDVNDYLREAAGVHCTAKDFRTWHGTVQALELVRAGCSVTQVLQTVARQLGNTPAVCRKSYVHPAVLAAAGVDGPCTEAAGAARARRHLQAAEARLLAFLDAQRRG